MIANLVNLNVTKRFINVNLCLSTSKRNVTGDVFLIRYTRTLFIQRTYHLHST